MIKEKVIVFIPAKLISEANNSDHWTKKRRRKRALQFLVRTALKGKYDFPLPCIVTLERVGVKLMDEDNNIHAFKNIRDQVAEIIIESQEDHKIKNSGPNLPKVSKMGSHDGDPRIKWNYAQRTQKNEFGKKHSIGFYVTIEDQ